MSRGDLPLARDDGNDAAREEVDLVRSCSMAAMPRKRSRPTSSKGCSVVRGCSMTRDVAREDLLAALALDHGEVARREDHEMQLAHELLGGHAIVSVAVVSIAISIVSSEAPSTCLMNMPCSRCSSASPSALKPSRLTNLGLSRKAWQRCSATYIGRCGEDVCVLPREVWRGGRGGGAAAASPRRGALSSASSSLVSRSIFLASSTCEAWVRM